VLWGVTLSRDDAVGGRAGSPDPAISPSEAGSGDPALQRRTRAFAELRARIVLIAWIRLREIR